MKLTNVTVAHHRNGISGEPFHAVAFNWRDGDGLTRHMIATVFEEPGVVAVIDAGLAAGGMIKFGVNSWRGDQFEPALRAAIAATL